MVLLEKPVFVFSLSGSAIPLRTLAILSRTDLDSNCLLSILRLRYLVTRRGVPQSITLLYLLSISTSRPGALMAYFLSFGFSRGAKSCFLSSSIFFCFSVLLSSTSALAYSSTYFFFCIVYEYGTSVITCFVGLYWLMSCSLQYSSFHRPLGSISSNSISLLQNQLFLRIILARIWATHSPLAPPKNDVKLDR